MKSPATLGDIKPNERNPRTISESRLQMLRDSLAEFGDLSGYIFNRKTQRLIGGHQRQKVMPGDAKIVLSRSHQKPTSTGTVAEGYITIGTDRHGYREVDWPAKKEKAAMLAANQHSGEWDTEELATLLKEMDANQRLLSGFDVAALKQIGIDLGASKEIGDFEPNADRAAELNKTWKVKAGDLWRIGDHRLLCGDSTQSADVKRALDGAKPWLMVTDPPYGVNYDPSWRNTAKLSKTSTLGKVTNDGRSQWASAYTRSGCEVAYVWHAGSFAATVAQDLTACGFVIRSQIIWAKKRFAIGRGDYHWAHEPCWYAVKDGATGRFYGNRKNTTLWADISDTLTGKEELYACQVDKETVYAFPAASTTVWTLPTDKPCDGGHSTQKPLECMARPIRNHGLEGDTVYDPFAGTGTTGIAAHAANRKARLIEISPSYCAVILERFKQQAGIEGKK